MLHDVSLQPVGGQDCNFIFRLLKSNAALLQLLFHCQGDQKQLLFTMSWSLVLQVLFAVFEISVATSAYYVLEISSAVFAYIVLEISSAIFAYIVLEISPAIMLTLSALQNV